MPLAETGGYRWTSVRKESPGNFWETANAGFYFLLLLIFFILTLYAVMVALMAKSHQQLITQQQIKRAPLLQKIRLYWGHSNELCLEKYIVDKKHEIM